MTVSGRAKATPSASPAVSFDDIEALEHAGERSGAPLLVKALCLIARELRLLRAGQRP